MIPRKLHEAVAEALGKFPVVALVGARQVGKTTLARALQKEDPFVAAGAVVFGVQNGLLEPRLQAAQSLQKALQGIQAGTRVHQSAQAQAQHQSHKLLHLSPLPAVVPVPRDYPCRRRR